MSDFLAALARARPRLRRRVRHVGAGPGPRPRRLRRPRARGLQRAPRAHPARPHPPDARRVLRGGRRRGRDGHVRRLPASCSTSTTSPRRPSRSTSRRRASPRRSRPDFSTPDQPRFVIGSIGPGTKLPSLGHIAFDELRDDYEAQVEGLLAGGVDVAARRDRLRPAPGEGGDHRRPPRDGVGRRASSRSWCR